MSASAREPATASARDRPPADAGLPGIGAADAAGLLTEVLAPLLARGLLIRRRRTLGLLARLDADRRAVRRLASLRRRHGPGPLVLALPGRPVALVLDPGHARRVLEETPWPFAAASREKRAALSHFQDEGVLVSRGVERAERRRFNERALESSRPAHGLAEGLVARARDEADEVIAAAGRSGVLDWDRFATGWWRLVRRTVLGDRARGDDEVTDLLATLRADANWAFMRPRRRRLRERFRDRLDWHLARAEEGSLAGVIAATPAGARAAPLQQVPQWLFAFDAAGMATFTSLALLDAHPAVAEAARTELAGSGPGEPAGQATLRATVLEAVRLWPTTPAILRESLAPTEWEAGTLAAGATVVIFTPFLHRDGGRLEAADRFAPELWLGTDTPEDLALVPFSAGPAACPGRNLVLLLASAFLGRVLERRRVRRSGPPELRADRPLPATLSPFELRFELTG